MKSKLSLVILLQAFIIVTLFWVLVFYGKDEYEAYTQETEEEIETPTYIETENGKTTVEVNKATQEQSEIITSPVQASSYVAEVLSYGKVISIAELINLRSQYLATKADELVVTNALEAAQKDYDRLYALNQDNKNVSDKVVTAALNAVNAHQTKRTALQSNARNIADSMRQQWGNALADLVIKQQNAALFKSLIQNQKVLLQITLPFSANAPKQGSTINIAPTSALKNIVKAHYFSPASGSDATIQGKTYFYYAKADFLRAGMPIKVLDYHAQSESKAGVMIPNEAVVWHAGKAWVYQKTSETEFVRLPINNDYEVDDGWFYQGQLQANDLIVTSGAQLLLSEEFKYQITNENDD